MRRFHALVFAFGIASLPMHAAWGPAVDEEGTVYSASAYSVQALTPTEIKWRNSLSTGLRQVVLVGDAVLVPYVSHSTYPGGWNVYNVGLYAFNKSDGKEKWKFFGSRDGAAGPPLAYAGVAVDPAGHVHYDGLVFDAQTGTILTNTGKFFASADGVDLKGEPYWYSRAIGRDGTHYEGVMGAVRARDHRTGVQKWFTRLLGLVGEPIIGEDETIYVSDETGTLYALDYLTGELLWLNEPLGENISHLLSNRRSETVALASNQVAVLRYVPVFTTNLMGYVQQELYSSLQTLDGKSGAVTGIFMTNFNPFSLSSDDELFRARPMAVTPQGNVYINERGWISGKFSYGTSTWPRLSARNDNIASLARLGAPAIIGQPQPAPVTNGTAVFAVYASGTLPLSYQWLKNGASVPGATNAVLTAGALAMTDVYQVRVSNSEGETVSAPASPGFTLTTEIQGGRIFVEPKLPAYPVRTTVTLRAESSSGRPFLGWSGSFNSTNNPLTITVNTNLHLAALFQHERLDLLALHTLAAPSSEGRVAVGTNGILYLPTQAGIIAFDARQRRELWKGGPLYARQVAVSPRGDIVTASPGSFYALNSSNGLTVWEKWMSVDSFAIDPGGVIFTFGTNVAAFSSEGVELWARNDVRTPSGAGGFIGPDGRLFVSAGSEVLSLDRTTGATLWRRAGSPVYPGPLNRLIVGSNMWASGSSLLLVDRETGRTLLTRSDPPVSRWDTYCLISSSGRVLLMDRNDAPAEWDITDNSITPLRSRAEYPAVLAGDSQVVLQGEDGLKLYNLNSRSFTSHNPSWPLNANRANHLTTILPDNRIARLIEPGYLLFHEAEPFVQTMSGSPGLNPQNTRCLLTFGPPKIITQPQHQYFVLGEPCSFAVDATGTPNLRYQWYRGSNQISGATGPELRISKVIEADRNAKFSVVVSNDEGTVQSLAAEFTGRIKTITEGPGIVQVGGPAQPRIGDLVTFRAVAAQRPFLHWSGSVESTNDFISVRLESNLVLRAVFDSLPGDLLWEIPLIPELAQNSHVLHSPIHFSELRAEALLPGLVRLDLTDLSFRPPSFLHSFSTVQRGEAVRAFTDHENTNLFVEFEFGSGMVRTSAFQFGFAPAIDSQNNMYATLESGLVKLGPNGEPIWTNTLPELRRNQWWSGFVRLGLDGVGAVFGYNKLFLFDTGTGEVRHQYTIDLSPVIFAAGPRLIASSSLSNQVLALDARSGSLVWSNSNGGLLVADNQTVYSMRGNRVVAMNLDSGETRWAADFPYPCCFHSADHLLLSADQRLYVSSDRYILCLSTTNGTKVWSVEIPPESGRYVSKSYLGPNGTLYLFSTANTLMAYKTSAGLADSGWPEPDGKGNGFAAIPPKPIVPASLSIKQSAQGGTLEFHAHAGTLYTLEKSPDLQPPNWQSVTSVVGKNGPVQLPVAYTSMREFLRVKAERE